MDSNQHAMQTNASQPGQQPGLGDKLRHSKALIPTLAVLAVTSLALAAALVSNRIGAQDGVKDGPAPVAAVTQKAPVRQAQVTQPNNTAPVARTQVAQACANCGVVESAVAVQRAGQVNGIANSGIGVGAVAGGLVGGLLGNQVGGGTGKKIATVGGAVAGGYAGNEIEKNQKTYTVWVVEVQERDGRTRRFERSADPGLRVGDEVRLTENGFTRT